MNIHTVGTDAGYEWSTGYLTVAMSDYMDFAKAVGFINQSCGAVWNAGDSYSTFTANISTTCTQSFSGKFVLDRSVLRDNLNRDRGTARVSEDMYRACMKYYFGETI